MGGGEEEEVYKKNKRSGKFGIFYDVQSSKIYEEVRGVY